MIKFKMNLSNVSSQPSFDHSPTSSKLPCQVILGEEYQVNLEINYYLTLIITSIIIALMTVISNGAFLIVVFRSRRLQTVHNILLVCLSMIDFVTGVIVTPVVATSLSFLMNQEYPCVLFWFWLISLYAVSMISFCTLGLISIEKYVAIVHPYYYERVVTKEKLILVTLAISILNTTFAVVIPLVGLSDLKTFRFIWSSLPYLGVIIYVTIFYCYGRIFKEIQKVRRRIAIENTIPSSYANVKKSSKVAKTTMVVIGAITLCYMPFIIANFFWRQGSYRKGMIQGKLEPSVKFAAYVAILFNSTLNPVIYNCRMSFVRREFKHFFCPRGN